ncbi:MAG: hypothetical protein KY442_12640, partial [Proteobacteria bacterium]|nr:hypothetical protein [Pseudomonadota bacterium]
MNAAATPAAPPSSTDTPAKAPIGRLRTLWPFVRRHRGLFAGWLVALAASSSATLSLPFAFRIMIDQGFAQGGGGAIDRAFVLLFAVALALAFATAARFFFVSLLGERVVADLRERLYAHLIALDAGFHDRNRSGELISRLTADAELLRSVVGTSMSVALRSIVTFLGSITMLFVTSPHLAAYALVGIPLAVLPIVIGGRRLQKISRSAQDRVADANALANETLGAVRTVQAHAREPYERGRFVSALKVAVDTARRRIQAQAWVTAIAITLIFGAITLVLAVLGLSLKLEVVDGALAATRLFAAGGAGGIALTAWALRRSGMPRRTVADKTLAFLILMYAVYMAALIVCGFGLYYELMPGPGPFGITLVPAVFALIVVALALGLSRVPPDLQRRLEGFARRGGRLALSLVAVAAALVALAGWAGSRRLRVRRLEARWPDLPPGLAGLRIAQLSDLHVGPQTSRRFLARVRRAVEDARPDLI